MASDVIFFICMGALPFLIFGYNLITTYLKYRRNKKIALERRKNFKLIKNDKAI